MSDKALALARKLAASILAKQPYTYQKANSPGVRPFLVCRHCFALFGSEHAGDCRYIMAQELKRALEEAGVWDE